MPHPYLQSRALLGTCSSRRGHQRGRGRLESGVQSSGALDKRQPQAGELEALETYALFRSEF